MPSILDSDDATKKNDVPWMDMDSDDATKKKKDVSRMDNISQNHLNADSMQATKLSPFASMDLWFFQRTSSWSLKLHSRAMLAR